jgi:hypothetical protein
MVHFPICPSEDASQAADKAHKHFASGYGDHLSLSGTSVALLVRLYHVVSCTMLCVPDACASFHTALSLDPCHDQELDNFCYAGMVINPLGIHIPIARIPNIDNID